MELECTIEGESAKDDGKSDAETKKHISEYFDETAYRFRVLPRGERIEMFKALIDGISDSKDGAPRKCPPYPRSHYYDKGYGIPDDMKYSEELVSHLVAMGKIVRRRTFADFFRSLFGK